MSEAAIELINGLGSTRRVERDSQKLATRLGITLEDCIAKYGIEGELYCDDKINSSIVHTCYIVDYSSPPVTQPDLFCQWIYDKDEQGIVWNGGEKFYKYVEWIKYITAVSAW